MSNNTAAFKFISTPDSITLERRNFNSMRLTPDGFTPDAVRIGGDRGHIGGFRTIRTRLLIPADGDVAGLAAAIQLRSARKIEGLMSWIVPIVFALLAIPVIIFIEHQAWTGLANVDYTALRLLPVLAIATFIGAPILFTLGAGFYYTVINPELRLTLPPGTVVVSLWETSDRYTSTECIQNYKAALHEDIDVQGALIEAVIEREDAVVRERDAAELAAIDERVRKLISESRGG